jgi:hypothetical protein
VATVQQTPFATQDPSATTIHARDVEDKVKHLVPASAKLFALIAEGKVRDGETTRSAGMISKKSADQVRVECYTHSPIAPYQTVVSVNGLALTFASGTPFYERQVWKNTANNTVGCVDKIASAVVTFITFGGTTFSATAGDVLIRLGNAYEESSENPEYIQQPDDQIYNVMQIFRFPVEISESRAATKDLAGGDYFDRMKKYNMIEGLRDIERSLIWGQRPNTTTTNVTAMTSLGVSVRHMRGLWNYAQNSYPMGNSLTPQKLQKDLILAMDRAVGNDKELIMFTSREVVARALAFQQDKLMYYNTAAPEKYGMKTHLFSTSGPDVRMVAHDAFDYGADTDKALLFIPDNITYRYLKGKDLRPKSNIQSPSKQAFKDEITGECCLLPDCGGYTITKVTDIF